MDYEFIFEKANGCIDFEMITNALNEQDARRKARAKNPLILDRLLQIVPAGLSWTVPSKQPVVNTVIDEPVTQAVKKYTVPSKGKNFWLDQTGAHTPIVIITDNLFRVSVSKWLLEHKYSRLISASLPQRTAPVLPKKPCNPVIMRDQADKSWLKIDANNDIIFMTPRQLESVNLVNVAIFASC
jgi:hypothetical protein